MWCSRAPWESNWAAEAEPKALRAVTADTRSKVPPIWRGFWLRTMSLGMSPSPLPKLLGESMLPWSSVSP
eukprot:9788905-Alexandrium_andersonii.AAC.1